MPPKRQTPTTGKTRVFLVDDHPIVRRGLQLILSLEPDLVVCGEADSGPAAFRKIVEIQPEVAIIDLTLRESSGLELLKQLRSQCPKLKILVFSMHDELYYAERVLRSGAHGYLTKEEGTEKALEALRVILQGKKYISQAVAGRMLDRLTDPGSAGSGAPIDRLSDRELEVLEMLGAGLGTRQIAQQLHLSVKTIESHREHLKEKLGLSSASELTQYAFKWVSRERPASGPA